ncbi:MAG: restriction endonuclease [Ectobacillus sp.]
MNWSSVNPRHFEKFIFHAIAYKGFRNREWYGRGGGDRGRDIVAKYYIELPFNLGYEQNWVFQCKREKRMPQQAEVYNEIVKAKQHHPDVWVLVTPHNPTANFYDFLRNIELNIGFKLVVFSLAELEEILYAIPQLKNVLENGRLPEGESNDV